MKYLESQPQIKWTYKPDQKDPTLHGYKLNPPEKTFDYVPSNNAIQIQRTHYKFLKGFLEARDLHTPLTPEYEKALDEVDRCI